MIQWIKDNKTFIVLAIIAVLLAIIIALMISGSKVPIVQNINSGQGVNDPYNNPPPTVVPPDNKPQPAFTMPPNMQPKPYVPPSPTPTSKLPGGL